MSKSMKLVALFLALAIAQTAAISSVYADDESDAAGNTTHKTTKKHKTKGDDSNGVKTYTPAPVKTVTPMPVKTITSTPIQTYTPTPPPTLNTNPTPAPATKTWATYNQYCSGCHGTSKQGSSVANIQTGISNNSGGMGSLKSLTAAQLAAIAAGQ